MNTDAYWLPFTSNRAFKNNPRIITAAKGHYYTAADGRQIFDGLSGLWTCGLGHNQQAINTAIQQQLSELDYSPAFNFAHPKAFQLAERLSEFTPSGLNKVFFTCSGSEAIDTAMKIARAYWRKLGKGSKTRFIGREKGYHGVNFGGISVGGIGGNRALYGQTIESDHLPHTITNDNKFSKGLPKRGAEQAECLLDLIALHGSENIAAVVVEPMSGSAGVIPPPQGYLQRLREICTANDILLIFDEVITGLGRVGAKTGAEAFAVTPDMMAMAKQITNGVVPMGAVVAKTAIYDAFMDNSGAEHLIELPHGYTYSAHPVACAAGLATLDLLEQGDVFSNIRQMATVLEDKVHQLQGLPYVTDIRNYGLAAGITLAAAADPLIRPYQVMQHCWEMGFYVRCGGDTIQLGLPFAVSEIEIDNVVNAVGEAINKLTNS